MTQKQYHISLADALRLPLSELFAISEGHNPAFLMAILKARKGAQ